jgi:hypothetical protein
MKDAQKPDHKNLNTLIVWLKEGRFVIPDFQREFEWQPWDINELIRSVIQDYYIGSLLLWKGKPENFYALSCEPIYGFEGESRPEYIVLDGQQRLTAMYYAFIGPEISFPRRTKPALFFINVEKFCEEEYDDAFQYKWRTQQLVMLMSDRQIQFAEHQFPLSVFGEGGWALPNWLQDYEKYWKGKAEEATEKSDSAGAATALKNARNAGIFSRHLDGIFNQYQISYIELDREIAVDKVCDIFTQINSRGIQLDVFDLMNALIKPHLSVEDQSLKMMWRKAAPRLAFIETEKMNVYILQVMSILRQAYCSPKYLYFLLPGHKKPVRYPDGRRTNEILITDIADFKKRWNYAIDALESSIKTLRHPREYGVIAFRFLPYVSIIPAFTALQALVKTLDPATRLDAQRKIRHWYWASVFTNRYSGSVESTTAKDFQEVKAWFDDDTAEPSLIQEFKLRFANLDLHKEVKRGSSIYNAIFNLLILHDARDWITGMSAQNDDLDDHHIVPVSWGEQNQKGKRTSIHTILNRTPLTKDTNRNFIRERLPNEYLPELIANNGENAVQAILEAHFISPSAQAILLRNPFMSADYEEFISERQHTMHHAIEDLLVKERLDLAPYLRDLDEKIEQTELQLRKLISDALNNDPNKLPPHVLSSVNDLIQRAAKKNPAMDIGNYQSLSAKLDFADLRELQDIITGKTYWLAFQVRFSNKEQLIIKFDQLAELRNGIRHSRAVDEIKRKEGEAAILWFGQVLNK